MLSVVGLLALGAVMTAPGVQAQAPATLTLVKSGPTTPQAPGTPFTYTLSYSCSSLTTTCNGVTIADVLPPELSHAASNVSLVGDSHTASTNYDPTTGTATFVMENPLAAGSTGQVAIVVQFPPNTTPVGTSTTNTATISGSNAGTVQSNPVTVAAVVTPAVAATKVLSTSPFVVGLPATYTVTWRNSGNVNLNSPTLMDALPAGLTCADVSSISGGGTCNAATNTITWTMAGPAAPSTTANFTQTFVATYPPATFPASTAITNSVTASGIPLGSTTAVTAKASTTNTPVGPAPAAKVTKSPGGTVLIGQNFTYTVSFQNTGNVGLNPVSMVDTLPAGLTCASGFVSASNGGTCDPATNRVTWTSTTTLAPGTTLSRTVVVNYPAARFTNGQTVTNSVQGSGTPVTGGPPVTGTASVNNTLSTPVAGQITVGKALTSPAVAQFTVGQPATYTITVKNTGQAGSGALTNYVVTDPLPAGLTCANVSAISNGGTCNATTNTITWSSLPNLNPGSTQTLTITVTYPSSAFTPPVAVQNCANLTGTYQGATVTPSGCTTNTLVASNPSATLTKTATPSTVPVGGNGTYTINTQNNGNIPLTNMVVDDVLPSNTNPAQNVATNVTFTDTSGLANNDILQYLDSTTGQFVVASKSCTSGICTALIPAAATEVRVTLTGSRPPGFTGGSPATAGFTLTLTLQVPPNAVTRSGLPILKGSTVVNCATMTADQFTSPPNPPAQACTTQTITEPVPNMSLTKTRTTPSPVPPPSPVSWQLVFGAPATSLAPILNPVVTDCLPAGLDLVNPSNPGDPANGGPPSNFTPAPTSITRVPGGGGCAANQIAVIWSWAGSDPALSIAPGTSGTFTLRTVLQPGTAPATLTNSASAIADNNSTPTPPATATVVVATGASLDSIKLIKGSLDPDFSKYPNVGHTTLSGSADYRMQITNTGNVPINKITAIDILPFVGDTAVLNTSAPRDSQWSPLLTGPVTAPAGVTVLYSTSTNPCRPDLNYNPPGCVSGSFSTTVPSPISSVASLEFQHAGTLAPGASIQIDWPMVAPATVIPGQVAWNSFAYTGFRTDNGSQLTPAEPNKVGMEIEPYPLEIEKDVNGVHEPNPPGLHITTGQTVTYSYLVTNPGDLTVTNLKLTDNPAQTITCNVPGVGTVPAADATIAPHSTLTCTADAGPAVVGQHSDTACVTGQPIVDGTPGTPTDQVCDTANYFGATPSIAMVKDVDGQHVPTGTGPFIPEGSPVTFTYLVTNTGNVTLGDVTLIDSVLGPITCPQPSLAPGGSMTCTGTQDSAVAGQQTNTANVTGQPVDNTGTPFGSPVTATDMGNYFGATPAITLVKNVNGQHEPDAPGLNVPLGNPVTFTYLITNTGNVTLDPVALTDSVLGTITCPATSLTPGDSMTCTAPGGNAALGNHQNTATVTGQGVDDSGKPVGPPVTDSDTGNYFANQATPEIVTTPSPGGVVGTGISDSARVSGGLNPSGTVTFNLYAPGDTTCAGNPVFTSTNPLSAGSATSDTFTTHTVGTFRWVAIYSGDSNNTTVSSGCQDEPVSESQATPTIATFPSAGGPVGSEIFDDATVSGGDNPTGTITFKLFGPGDATCSGTPVFVSTVSLVTRSTGSAAFTTTAVGTFHWVATYNGDADNASVASGCTEEPVTIGRASSAVITTVPSAGGVVGTAISDLATVSGGHSPTGSVTFELFPPTDLTCAGTAVFTSTNPLSGASAVSSSFTTNAVGTWNWVATYNGDVNNTATSTKCTEEQVDTSRGHPHHRDPAVDGRCGGDGDLGHGDGERWLQPHGQRHLRALRARRHHLHRDPGVRGHQPSVRGQRGLRLLCEQRHRHLPLGRHLRR